MFRKLRGLYCLLIPRLAGSVVFIDWDLTRTCQKRCAYCNSFTVGKVDTLRLGKALETVDWIHDLGCRIIGFLGGEPTLLGNQFVRIVEYASRRGIYCYVATNGELLTERYLRELIKAGVGMIDVAVDVLRPHDGLDKDIYSLHRRGVLERLDQACNDVDLKFNSVLTRRNIPDLRVMLSRFSECGYTTSVHRLEMPLGDVPILKPYDAHAAGHLAFSTREDTVALLETLDWLIAGKRNGSLLLSNPVAYFAQMQGASQQRWGCKAGEQNFHINAEGGIELCTPMAGLVYGKVGGTLPFRPDDLERTKSRCEKECFSCTKFSYAYYEQHIVEFVREWFKSAAPFRQRGKFSRYDWEARG